MSCIPRPPGLLRPATDLLETDREAENGRKRPYPMHFN